MGKGYDDFAIVSPDKVEQMAREYALARSHDKVLRQTAERHRVRAEFGARDRCMGLILKADKCMDMLIGKNPRNATLRECKDIVGRIRVVYEGFFCECDMRAEVLDVGKDVEREVVDSLLRLVEELVPIAQEDEIRCVIKGALEAVRLAVL